LRAGNRAIARCVDIHSVRRAGWLPVDAHDETSV
jgi:hypothetical protein